MRAEGRSAQGRLLRLTAAPGSAGEMARFGLITSRRLGGAVVRNRVRRRLREICRLHRAMVVPGWLVVATAKTAAAEASFCELREEWLLLARRAFYFVRLLMNNMTRRQSGEMSGCSCRGHGLQSNANMTSALLIFLIHVYRWVISPALRAMCGGGCGCRFEPSCSEYCLEAVKRHGAARGLLLGIKAARPLSSVGR